MTNNWDQHELDRPFEEWKKFVKGYHESMEKCQVDWIESCEKTLETMLSYVDSDEKSEKNNMAILSYFRLVVPYFDYMTKMNHDCIQIFDETIQAWTRTAIRGRKEKSSLLLNPFGMLMPSWNYYELWLEFVNKSTKVMMETEKKLEKEYEKHPTTIEAVSRH